MAGAKDIIIKVIPADIANDFIIKNHYSGKIVHNSNLHFGCFAGGGGRLHGVMSFGSSINKKGTIKLVENTSWNEFIELNRMAFDEYLPKNSESRCLSVAIRLIRKNTPYIKWIISFADGTQSGDGTIYRASGFKLTGITKNTALRVNPKTGQAMHVIQAHHKKISKIFRSWDALSGFQLRYIYLIDKSCKITVPIIPFSKIDELGAGMYLGKKISIKERRASVV